MRNVGKSIAPSSLKMGHSVSVLLRQDGERYIITGIKEPIAKTNIKNSVSNSSNGKGKAPSAPQLDHSKHDMAEMDEIGGQK